MSWRSRAVGREIIDDPRALTPAQTARVLHELALVNRWLGCGAYRRGLRKTIGVAHFATGGVVKVLDVGAGGGDIARDTARRSQAAGIATRWVLVDFSHDACRFAAERSSSTPGVAVVRADVRRLPFAAGTFDVVTCAAFLHHFSERELPPILDSLASAGRTLIFNDLHRSRIAGLSIRVLTGLLSRSPAVRHDGPLSVRKGFRRHELARLLAEAGLHGFEIRWRWPFRWVVTKAAGDFAGSVRSKPA